MNNSNDFIKGYKRMAKPTCIITMLGIAFLVMIPGASAGCVVGPGQTPIEGALVKLVLYPTYSNLTDSSGCYILQNVPNGTYEISASKAGYATNVSTVFVPATQGVEVTKDFILSSAFYTYFAEGYVTADNAWREYITVGNPNDVTANVTISHMLADGSTIDKVYSISPNTRFTENVGTVLTGANSPMVISDIPVVVERPIYFTNALGLGIIDGHNSIGATDLSTTWYFAEGYVSPEFKPYITIQNPNSSTANVKIKHVLSNGGIMWNNVTINPTSRYTESVSSVVPNLLGVSFVITSDVPIVAERPIYFKNAFGGTISGGHNTIGTNKLSKEWYFAEGYVTADGSWKEYLTLGNPNDAAANVTVSHMLSDGTSTDMNYIINPNSRFTENVATVLTGANSIKVTSNISIIAERPIYFTNALGLGIVGGHNTMGATDLSATWYFAEGYVSAEFKPYITIQNPNSSAANVKIKHVLSTGGVLWNNVTINPTSRYTESVSSIVPVNTGVSFVITSDIPIVSERPIYFKNAFGGTVSGGHNTIGYSRLG